MSENDKSLYYDEFSLGDQFFSAEHIMDATDITNFAEVSGDYSLIHLDEGYAAGTIYGRRIAHGLLVLSTVSGLAAKLGLTTDTTIAFRSMDWKFKRPVYIGDSIKAVLKVVKKRNLAMKEGGLIVFKVDVTNQEDQRVQMGRWSMIIKKK
jgi:acyl dehydratase